MDITKVNVPTPSGRYSSVWAMPSGPGSRGAEDPHELRRGRRPHLGPRVRQVVLHGRVRQAEAVGGGLLRPGDEDGGNHADLAVGGALGGVATAGASCAAQPVEGLRRLPRAGIVIGS